MSDTSVEFYSEHSFKDVLSLLDLNFEDRLTKISERSPYVGSGEWSIWRDRGTGAFNVSVDVGCCCSHDCCGHLCGLDYNIYPNACGWVVVTHKTFNY